MTYPSALRAAQNLRRVIPPPAPPKPKAQGSFHLLKPGQWLRNNHPLTLGRSTLPPNSLWQVVGVNSLGATLKAEGSSLVTHINNPKWKETAQWTRARKPPKSKPASGT